MSSFEPLSRKRKAGGEQAASPKRQKRTNREVSASSTPATTSLAAVAAAVSDQEPLVPARKGWWHGSIAPAPVGRQEDSCPIDWNHPKLKDVTAEQKDMYELKSPWKPVSDKTNPEAQAILNARYGRSYNTETWRKKFMRTNLLVFRATNQWWERLYIGLERHVGKCAKNKKEKKALKTKRPPVVKYHGQIFTIYIQDPDEEDGTWIEERGVPLAAACQASPFFAESVKKGVSAMTVKTTPDLLDSFTSCFAPKRLTTLPKVGHRLILDEAEDSHYFITFPTNFTLNDLFQLYNLASGLDSIGICDMILDEWRDILRQEQQLRHDFQTGTRSWTDLPAGPIPDILDFSPSYLNTLWESQYIDSEDTARTFWLDTLALKGEAGYEKIKDELEDYSDAFLEDWMKCLPLERRQEVVNMHGERHTESQGTDGTSKTSSRNITPEPDEHDEDEYVTVQDVSFPSIDPDTASESGHQDQMGEDSPTSNTNKETNKESASSHTSFESIQVTTNAEHNGFKAQLAHKKIELATIKEKLESLRRAQRKDEDEMNDEWNDIADASGSEYTDSLSDPTILLNGNSHNFCMTYHNHNRLKICCYKVDIPIVNSNIDVEVSEVTTTRPSHHINMEINGIPGFIIQNHTGYSTRDFQDLPNSFPEWDWEKVRSINCYEDRKQGEDYGLTPRPIWLPRPVYFDGGYIGQGRCPFQDEFGRWPCHPGYRNANWVKDDADREDDDGQEESDEDLEAVDADEDDGDSDEKDENEGDSSEDEDGRSQEYGQRNGNNGEKRKRDQPQRWVECFIDRQADKEYAPTAPVFSRQGYGFDGYRMCITGWY